MLGVPLKIIAIALFSALFVIPTVSFPTELYAQYVDVIFGILEGVCYFLPMPTVFVLFAITVGLMAWRLAVSLLRTIWDILPIV